MNKEQILKRMREIGEELEKRTADTDVNKLNEEFRSLKKDLQVAELRAEMQKTVGEGEGKADEGDGKDERKKKEDDIEKRARDLKEGRAVQISTDPIVVPNVSSSTINDTFPDVSTLANSVSHLSLNGGESFKQPYIKGSGSGDYTKEGTNYNDLETKFGYSDIIKTKITTYIEYSEELEKLPAAPYVAKIQEMVRKAIDKKKNMEIANGDGGAEHFSGIFLNPSEAEKQHIDPATDIEVAEINADTLNEIIFSYGGDEEVEHSGDCTLILNKQTLREFSQVKYEDGRKVYEIKKGGNTGSINGVPYIITSGVKAFSDPSIKTGDYFLAYGYLDNYEMVEFSPLEIMKSTDFKFKQGMIAVKASVFAGGNVVSHNGFLRVKKGVAPIGGTRSAGMADIKKAIEDKAKAEEERDRVIGLMKKSIFEMTKEELLEYSEIKGYEVDKKLAVDKLKEEILKLETNQA